jgi:hypothetical protein
VKNPETSYKPRCQHTNKNGSPCQADPQTGKPYCFFHDPEQQQKRSAARKQGGEVRSRATAEKNFLPPNLPFKSLETPSDVADLLSETIHQFLRGEIDLDSAKAIGQMANVLLSLMKVTYTQKRVAARSAKKKEVDPGPDNYLMN